MIARHLERRGGAARRRAAAPDVVAERARRQAPARAVRPPFIVDGFNFCRPEVRRRRRVRKRPRARAAPAGTVRGWFYLGALTARMLRATLGVKPKLLRTIDVGETIEIEAACVPCGADGAAAGSFKSARVTALDAGHCPGALLFLFEDVATGHRALHTGDCRASEAVVAAAVRALRPAAPASAPSPTPSSRSSTCSTSTRRTPTRAGASRRRRRRCGCWHAWWRRSSRASRRRSSSSSSYEIGKEKAIDAVVRASGGRALVPPRRAMSLRLCGWWDDALHTEADAPDVAVHVAPMSSAGADAHATMVALLEAQGGRYAAVVSLRPTGWAHVRTRETPRVWAENEGRTRVYGVAYSEHSSFPELQALVGALRPRLLVPTVNAETREARERLQGVFAHRATSSPTAAASTGTLAAAAARRPPSSAAAGPLAGVDVAAQRELWARLSPRPPVPPADTAEHPVDLTGDDDDDGRRRLGPGARGGEGGGRLRFADRVPALAPRGRGGRRRDGAVGALWRPRRRGARELAASSSSSSAAAAAVDADGGRGGDDDLALPGAKKDEEEDAMRGWRYNGGTLDETRTRVPWRSWCPPAHGRVSFPRDGRRRDAPLTVTPTTNARSRAHGEETEESLGRRGQARYTH